MKSIDEQWREYGLRCGLFPSNAPAVQVQEMRRAFFAGAGSLLMAMRQFDDSLSDDAGAKMFQQWASEINEFWQGEILSEQGARLHDLLREHLVRRPH
jgi:hypothetical protein